MYVYIKIFTYIIFTDLFTDCIGPLTGETIDGVDGSPVTPQQRFVDANDLFEGHLAGGYGMLMAGDGAVRDRGPVFDRGGRTSVQHFFL